MVSGRATMWARAAPPPEAARPRVALVSRREPGVTGTSRYAASLARALEAHDFAIEPVQTGLGPALTHLCRAVRRLGPDLATFCATYPLHLAPRAVDLYHLTAQNLATLLLFQRFPVPVVVTVHDIIPYLLRHNQRLSAYAHLPHRGMDRLALAGLHRATALIADSAWTKTTVVDELGIPADRVVVAHCGVDHARFRPLNVPPTLRRRYDLPEGPRYLVYVGSEERRKNLDSLLQALAALRRDRPDVRLVKVGAPQVPAQRQLLRQRAAALGVDGAVHWIDHVPEADLPLLYNLATVCVVPSYYEGFGLPVIEAMACGLPVVCANAASLPEIAGGAAALAAPTPQSLYEALSAVLDDPAERARLAQAGMRRAAQFTWEATARAVAGVYRTLLSGTACLSDGGAAP